MINEYGSLDVLQRVQRLRDEVAALQEENERLKNHIADSNKKVGRWINLNTFKNTGRNNFSNKFKCSRCQGFVELAHYCYECYYDYCPYCGDKMRDNKKEDE